MSEPLYSVVGELGAGAARGNAQPAFITKPCTGEASTLTGIGDIRVLGGLPTHFGNISRLGIPLGANIKFGSINAMVTMQGRPISRPVWVLDQRGVLVAKTTSDEAGRYVVEGLDKGQRYIVLSLDKPEREYNAAISDYVQPE